MLYELYFIDGACCDDHLCYGLSLFTVCVCVVLFLFFFFQAEDGIRYLVRSRGLGDVYKRQETI